MSESKYTATLKAGSTFDSPWIVLYFDTAAEGKALLDEAAQQGLDVAVANAAKELQAKYAAAGLGGTTVVSTETTAPQAAPVQAPAAAPQTAANTALPHDGGGATAAVPTCHHGVKVYREAKPGSGKSWKGYFCPSPRGTADQCPPEFLKDR